MTYSILQGDCLAVLKTLPDNSVDSVVTDPPYLIDFMGKSWDSTTIDPAFGHYIAGIVDGEGCFRVHKAHGATSTTYTCEFNIKLRDDDSLILHKIQQAMGVGRLHACAGEGNSKPQLKFVVTKIEDCKKVRRFFENFPLRAKKQKDFVHWCKHLDLWAAHTYGADKTALRESYEEMKDVRSYENTKAPMNPAAFFHYLWAKEVLRVLKPGGYLLSFAGTRTYHRMVQGIEDGGFEIRDCIMWCYGQGFPKSLNIGKETGLPEHEGWGTALKPAVEPIVVARKPLSESTVAKNVLKWGTGGLNVDGCRVETADVVTNHSRSSVSAVSKGKYGDSSAQGTHQTDGQALGRFPANLILDEEAASALDEQSGISAARFFYCAKSSKSDRGEGNVHPTCKPTSLMAYLCKLITPPGGLVLDPFAGSGSTGVGAIREGFRFVCIEREAEYTAIAETRLAGIA